MSFSDFVTKWIYQMAHVGWGAFLTLALARHTSLAHAALWVLVFATAKEAIFDPLAENASVADSGWQDWLFWDVGIVLGMLAFLI